MLPHPGLLFRDVQPTERAAVRLVPFCSASNPVVLILGSRKQRRSGRKMRLNSIKVSFC